MAALAARIWSGHTAALDAASSVGSARTLFRHHQCRHLDTRPQVSQVVEVAGMQGSSAFEGDRFVPFIWSGEATGQRMQSAENGVGHQECNMPSHSLKHPGASRRLPPVQTSKVMKPASQDCQIGQVHRWHRFPDCTGSTCLTHACLFYWDWVVILS